MQQPLIGERPIVDIHVKTRKDDNFVFRET